MSFLQMTEKDAKLWMSLVEQRGSRDPMYRMADRMQASLVITGILSIQGIYEGVAQIVDQRGGIFTVDDLNKLMNSLNRGIASVNSALLHLGVTGNKREEPVDTDALAQALRSYNIEDETPPGLEESYLSSRRELERADDPTTIVVGTTSLDKSEALSILKEPLKSHIDSSEEELDMPDMIDVEKGGIKVL
jgi:hypothetical protein